MSEQLVGITPTTNVEDFIGRYRVKWGAGGLGIVESGYVIYIGTGTHFAPPPKLSDDYRTVIGVSIFQQIDGREVMVLPESETAWFAFEAGALNYAGWSLPEDHSPVPTWIQISLVQIPTESNPYKGIYFVTVGGDPEQVGTWGADDEHEEGGD